MRRPVLVGLLLLTGCGTPVTATAELASDPPPVTTTTTIRRITTTTTVSPRDLFLTVVRSEVSDSWTDQQLVDIARTFCAISDEIGVDGAIQATAEVTLDTGSDPGDVGYILGAGVAAFCPEHSAGMQRAARRLSR